MSALVAQGPVLQMESCFGEPLQGRALVKRMRPEAAVEPELICGRNHSDRRLRMPAKRNAGQVGAVDRLRDRATEIGRAEPRLLVIRNGRALHLVEPHVLTVE